MEIQVSFVALVGFAALNLLGVLAVLAGVFLGGVLVYKTRFAGQPMFQKKPEVPQGEAGPVADEYGDEDFPWQERSSLVGESKKDTADPAEDALERMLGRNQSFKDRLERSVFQPKAGNVQTVPDEEGSLR